VDALDCRHIIHNSLKEWLEQWQKSRTKVSGRNKEEGRKRMSVIVRGGKRGKRKRMEDGGKRKGVERNRNKLVEDG
jgi:hypothetical protein